MCFSAASSMGPFAVPMDQHVLAKGIWPKQLFLVIFNGRPIYSTYFPTLSSSASPAYSPHSSQKEADVENVYKRKRKAKQKIVGESLLSKLFHWGMGQDIRFFFLVSLANPLLPWPIRCFSVYAS
jgi:hypothetical protein